MLEDILNENTPAPKAISNRQEMLLDKLVEEPDIRKAAQEAGISKSTLYRWLKEPAFQYALCRQRSLIHSNMVMEMRSYTSKALHALKDLLESENEGVRFKAGNAILGHTLRLDTELMK